IYNGKFHPSTKKHEIPTNFDSRSFFSSQQNELLSTGIQVLLCHPMAKQFLSELFLWRQSTMLLFL
ncbi:hypothetical protein BMF91_24030, partial [Serratia sp. OLFL2]